MKRLLIFLILLPIAMASQGQNISITFSATGPSNQIDSVTATNLATDESITLPGNETLLLTPKTGIYSLSDNIPCGIVFPNPFPGRTTLNASIQKPQTVIVKVQNLAGQTVAQTQTFVQVGENEFILSLSAEGIYLVSLTTDQGTTCYKVISTGTAGHGNSIQYRQLTTDNRQLKSSQSSYSLGYSAGDTIRYRCRSTKFNAIFTDSPTESKNYEVAFSPIASFTIDPSEGNTETKFALDASGCSDAETPADDLEVRWDFDGDGNWETDWETGKYSGFQFQWAGTWSIILEVRDAGGLTASESIAVTIANAPEGTFTDPRDNHRYPYKTFGTQAWMTRNLDWLPEVSPPSVVSDTIPHYYVYGYEGTAISAAKETENYKTYGVLYNFPAALAACPAGWHLPGDEEWKTLEIYLGMSAAAADSGDMRNTGAVGGKLKEAGFSHWYSPNKGASNSSGFTALPGGIYAGGEGYRTFTDYRGYAYYGSPTELGSTNILVRLLTYNYDGVARWVVDRPSGVSVRCVRN